MLNHTYVLLFLFDYQPEVLLFFTFSTGEITFSLPQLLYYWSVYWHQSTIAAAFHLL